jgi:hypothetical protein
MDLGQPASHSRGDGGSRVVCSGCQGLNDLGFCITHCLGQNHCCHCGLGGIQVVCGERGG